MAQPTGFVGVDKRAPKQRVNQALRFQDKQNQAGQSSNTAALNIANMRTQAPSAPILQQQGGVADAISRGTTVPQMQQQNMANQMQRAEILAQQNRAANIGTAQQHQLGMEAARGVTGRAIGAEAADLTATGLVKQEEIISSRNDASIAGNAALQTEALGQAKSFFEKQLEFQMSTAKDANTQARLQAIALAYKAQLESGKDIDVARLEALGAALGNESINSDDIIQNIDTLTAAGSLSSVPAIPSALLGDSTGSATPTVARPLSTGDSGIDAIIKEANQKENTARLVNLKRERDSLKLSIRRAGVSGSKGTVSIAPVSGGMGGGPSITQTTKARKPASKADAVKLNAMNAEIEKLERQLAPPTSAEPFGGI